MIVSTKFCRQFLLVGAAVMGLAQGSMATAQSAPPASTAGADDSAGGDIVVTAERRSDSAQNVPISLTALGSDTIARANPYTMVDLTRYAPAIRAYNNAGNSLGGAFYMRGVGQGDSSPLADAPVGIYIDDVFIARQWINNAPLFDLERVEILRGPQGVLYGRNTTAGAVKYITVQPEREFGGKLDLGYGSYNQIDARGVINLPLNDKLSARVSAYYQSRDGYVDNVQKTDEDNTGRNNGGIRGQLRFDDGVGTTVDLSASVIRSRTDGDVGSNFLYPGSTLFRTYSGNDNFSNLDNFIGSLTIAHKGDNFSLKSISAHTNSQWDYSLDFSGLPNPVFVYNAIQNNKTYSQEFQGGVDLFDNKVSITAGLFGYYEDSATFDQRNLFGRSVQTYNDFELTTRSLAAYAQASYTPVPFLTFIGGLRYTDEVRKLTRLQAGSGANDVYRNTYDLTTIKGLGISTRLHESKLNPKFGFQVRPVEGMMLYGTYTEGFRSGSYGTRQYIAGAWQPYSAEDVKSYEFGFKGSFINRITLNVNAYQATYDNYIGSAIDQATNQNLQDNVGLVRWRGLEGDVRIRMFDPFSIIGGFSLADGKVLRAIPGSSIDGISRLNQTPEITANIGFDWDIAKIGGAELNLTANYYYQEATIALGAVDVMTDPLKLVDASLRLDLPASNLQFTAYCRNCTNQHYYFTRLAASTLGFVTYAAAEPRSYGIKGTYRF